MGIILGVIQSFINSIGMILTKKVVENKSIGNNWQTFINRFSHTIFVLLFSIFLSSFIPLLSINISGDIFTIFNILLFLGATIGLYITYPLRRIAYANEKISVLQPFAMLFQVFPVILGFVFIASERVNIITFLMSLLASLIVIFANVNFKKFEINKFCLMVLASSSIKSVQVFAAVYFLTLLSPSTFYFLESILIIVISAFLILVNKELYEYKKITKKYAKLLTIANTVIIFSILLALTMFSTLGIVATSLLSLLYLVFLYIFSYIFLKDIPSKKDIIVVISVAICIVVGMYFKVV